MSKYKSRKITVGGITFDSKREAKRYQELYFQQRAGEISCLELQRRFELIPAQYETRERYSEKTGKKLKDKAVLVERRCCYVADFVYTDLYTGEKIVEDVKGYRTEVYKIKKKLFEYKYKDEGLTITEI